MKALERCRKKGILSMAAAMAQANDSIRMATRNPQSLTELLVQCQNDAMQIGASLEALDKGYASIVRLLEDYCENIYQISVSLSDENACSCLFEKIDRQLAELQEWIRHEMPDDRREAVFLPYKASMWDSLESVWRAADEDEDTDVYVIPIPYFNRNPDGSLGEEHYEGDLYPAYVPATDYREYDFELRHPDMIFIHNAYDEKNYVTSVHPFFYSANLKKYTDRLVYIPYFVLGEVDSKDKAAIEGMEHFCTLPGVFHADKVVVQSEMMRQIYIDVLTRFTGERTKGYWKEKILGTGSPKIDKVLHTKEDMVRLPEKWAKVIQKPDGEWKKVILYNTSVNGLLVYGDKMIEKMKRAFLIFSENKENIALIWRPHPLAEATIKSMRPQLWEKYHALVENYKEEGWGIYDDTPELDRAIAVSDGYYGDSSSLVELCRKAGVPVMIQSVEVP